MKISEPERYKLDFDARKFVVTCSKGSNKFSGFSTSKKPKLYVVSVRGDPIYVGVTRQPIRNRLRLGWSASGSSGYYGYKWRHEHKTADLDIWCQLDRPAGKTNIDIETVEAEVVFLIRCSGQWPPFQTEIHFHVSSPHHRKIAESIAARYLIGSERLRAEGVKKKG